MTQEVSDLFWENLRNILNDVHGCGHAHAWGPPIHVFCVLLSLHMMSLILLFWFKTVLAYPLWLVILIM
jgi:hypothetical protein